MDTQTNTPPQTGEKTYNIGYITNATFVYPDGKGVPFNDYLLKVLMTAIEPYNEDAQEFFEDKVKEKHKDNWINMREYSDPAKAILISGFSGILGSQIQNLIAIGISLPIDERSYVDKCISTAKNILQILCFAMISELWNREKDAGKAPVQIPDTVTDFFDQSAEMSIEDSFSLFSALYTLFKDNNLLEGFAIEELKTFGDNLKPESLFYQACDELYKISVAPNAEKYTVKSCGEVEKHLTHLLGALSFMASYKMVSIKSINYESTRNMPAQFLHGYTPLGFGNSNTKLMRYKPGPIDTDSVLLFRNDYLKSSINLSPFIIDHNALTFQDGIKVGFFSAIEKEKKPKKKSEDDDDDEKDEKEKTESARKIAFRFLIDDSIVELLVANPNEPAVAKGIQNEDTRKKIKLDSVSRQFLAAREAICSKQ